MQHFLDIEDVSIPELQHLFDASLELRRQRTAGRRSTVLAGKTLAMIFEKPSLRTRVSFEQAMLELGGQAIAMGSAEVGLGKREPPADVARVLSGMVQGILARVFEHQKLVELVQHSQVPVVNALSDRSHPCQELADALTLMDEFGRDLKGRTLAFIGDGNNVARSLATLCAKLGMRFVIASPEGYELEPQLPARLRQEHPQADIRLLRSPVEAVREADAVYTDTWVSMGQEAETEQRRGVFAAYQVSEQLMSQAPKHTVVLHCLPAYRGMEISEGVIEGPRSRVFPQAHNRLHVQKGLLAVLMGGL
jgi:ornithine carbamoyltransferase